MPVSPPRGPAFNVEHHDVRDPAVLAAAAAHQGRDRDLRRALRVDGARHALVRRLGRLRCSRRSATGRRTRSSSTCPTTASCTASIAGPARTTRGKSPSRSRWSSGIPAALPASRAFASDALVQNVDLAPTILDAVGIPWGGDGQSFLPVIERKKHTVRTAALIEHCRGVSRGIPDCSGYNFNGARTMTPGFQGVITDRYKYVEFDDGSRQLIDLQKDPHEFHDLSRNPGSAGLRRQMVAKLHALVRPRLQTTIATGPDGPSSSRVAAVLVLLAVPVRDLPMPIWSATARPLHGARARVGSSASTISPTAGTGSRSRASRKAAGSIARRRPAAFTLSSTRSRCLARQLTRQRPAAPTERVVHVHQHDVERSSSNAAWSR